MHSILTHKVVYNINQILVLGGYYLLSQSQTINLNKSKSNFNPL